MKLVEAPPPVFDPPPPELRRWHRRVSTPSGDRAGAEAYPSRSAWTAARRRWATRRGQTVQEWYAAELALAREELRSLEMLPYAPDPDEELPQAADNW